MTDPVEPEGSAVRRRVFGPEGPTPQSPATDAEAAFSSFVTQEVWAVWDRPGLDLATRRAVTIALLVALGRPENLALHARGALANGMSAEEIGEIVLHCAIYCGVPAADAAFKALRPLLADAGPPKTAADPHDS